MVLAIDKVRADFPILSTRVHGKPLVYLDNGATTQKPWPVIKQIEKMYTSLNANIHRGVHYLSQQATAAHESARETVRQFIHAGSTNEIVFTRGTTESINLIASSFCKKYCSPGDEILVTEMEHHSNIVPWQMQQEQTGIVLKVVPINEAGELELDKLEQLLTHKTKLLSLTYVSNVLGTVNPIQQIVQLAHQKGIPVLVDAAQAVQHLPIDVQALDCDFLVFSGHKVYAPTGIGVLYGKESWLEELPPYQGGGEMIATVSFEKTVFNELPFKFEAGTPDYVGSTALAAALDYVQLHGMETIKEHEEYLLHYATQELKKIEGIRIYGEAVHKSSVLSFLIRDIHHYDMGMLLDQLGIAVRTGHHCAQPLLHRYGIEGTVRVSFAMYNTKEEVDILLEGIHRVVGML